ncbi:MAG: cation:proton antiporter [Gammaproteobacteria bacterium]
MTVSELYLLALLIIFTVPFLVWRFGRTDHFAPLVVVQIVTGILLGPGVLGAWLPEYYEFIFTPPVVQSLNAVALWAVMLFVFLAGLELDLRSAWRERRDSAIAAGFALVTPLCAGALVAVWLIGDGGWIGSNADGWQFILGIGMASAVTALPILALFLERLQLLKKPLGQRILRYASLDDILIWGVLALILTDWARLGKQGVFLAAFAIVAIAIRRLMPRISLADRWYVSLIWLAACGLGADWCGLHFMVGAFLAGAVLDHEWLGEAELAMARRLVLLLLMPVFFLSTGLRTNWEMGGFAVIMTAGLLLLASVGGKLLGIRLAGRVLGWTPLDAKIIGWLLQTKALIEIIFASVLLDRQVISSATFTALLLMAIASTMLTIPRVSPLLRARGTSTE